MLLPRLTTALTGALVFAACAQGQETPSAIPADPPASQTAATPAPESASSRPLPSVDPASLRPDGLDPALHACIPVPGFGFEVEYFETARASDGGDEYVYIEWFETLSPDAAFDSRPVLLRLRGGQCEALVGPAFEAEETDFSRLVPAAALAEIDEENLAWKVAIAGGPEAYEARLRQSGRPLVECAGDPDGQCVWPQRAALLRRAGIDVQPPVPD